MPKLTTSSAVRAASTVPRPPGVSGIMVPSREMAKAAKASAAVNPEDRPSETARIATKRMRN
jgi:hypothetical protein